MIAWIATKIWEKFKREIMEFLKDDVKEIISKITSETIESSFSNDDALRKNGWAVGNIKNAINKAVEENLYKELRKRINELTFEQNEYIKSEKFINEVINRINMKQIRKSELS